MQIEPGQLAVLTGGGTGIGRALAGVTVADLRDDAIRNRMADESAFAAAWHDGKPGLGR